MLLLRRLVFVLAGLLPDNLLQIGIRNIDLGATAQLLDEFENFSSNSSEHA